MDPTNTFQNHLDALYRTHRTSPTMSIEFESAEFPVHDPELFFANVNSLNNIDGFEYALRITLHGYYIAIVTFSSLNTLTHFQSACFKYIYKQPIMDAVIKFNLLVQRYTDQHRFNTDSDE